MKTLEFFVFRPLVLTLITPLPAANDSLRQFAPRHDRGWFVTCLETTAISRTMRARWAPVSLRYIISLRELTSISGVRKKWCRSPHCRLSLCERTHFRRPKGDRPGSCRCLFRLTWRARLLRAPASVATTAVGRPERGGYRQHHPLVDVVVPRAMSTVLCNVGIFPAFRLLPPSSAPFGGSEDSETSGTARLRPCRHAADRTRRCPEGWRHSSESQTGPLLLTLSSGVRTQFSDATGAH